MHAVSPNVNFTATRLNFNPATLPTHDIVKTAVARVARWKDADVNDLLKGVDTATQNGVTRYLVPVTTAADSSAITTLFNRNAANPGFLDGKYTTEARKMVNDKIVVTSADMTKAMTSLKENLTTKSDIAHGLTFTASDLHGDTGEGIVRMTATVHRTPLHADHFDAEGEIHTSKCMTINSALQCMGEDVGSSGVKTLGEASKPAPFSP